MPRPIVVLAGGNDLAIEVCREFAVAHDVRFVWKRNEELRARVEAAGGTYFAGPPDDPETIRAAGIAEAVAVVAVDSDDRVNLDVALNARAVDRNVRIVLSQFSRGLGEKLRQNIPNCSVISPAAHSAATFAAAALDPSCFYGVEFPVGSGRLFGFSRGPAADLEIVDESIAQAEQRLSFRIVSTNGEIVTDSARVLRGEEQLITIRHVDRPIGRAGKNRERGPVLGLIDGAVTLVRELDPLVRAVLAVGLLVFIGSTIFFAYELKVGWVTAAYFVTETLTTVGYGDYTLASKPDEVKLVGMFVMMSGIVVTNLTVAFLSAALVRAQWIALQGLRRIHASGHVVVCGAGRVGMRVVEYLHALGIQLVIIEQHPAPTILRFGRERRIALLTGNAVEDETLDLCDVERARSVVVLTDSDTANLEVGLGIRARKADIPVIMRVASARFATRIKDQFDIPSAFSPDTLSTPAIVGLAASPNARGTIAIGERVFAIEESLRDAPSRVPRVVLAVGPGNTVLRLVQLV